MKTSASLFLLASALLLPVAFAGCSNGGNDDTTVGTDEDADGFYAGVDCNDADASINPGAPELCDGLDNDCDEEIDEDVSDADGDGICDQLDTETCDGIDNNGNGKIDEGFPDIDKNGEADCVDVEECDGIDNDGDGAIDEDQPDTDGDGICDGLDAEDCDGIDNDGDGLIDEDFPDSDGDGKADCLGEACDGLDNNGDGNIDEGYPDTDGDGVADCVDTETCDGVDNNGDGNIDEGFPDTDGDGKADCTEAEICDGLDNDGDGLVDEDFGDSDDDGIADCLDLEECDGLDNDGDGDIDEGFTDSDSDGTADCVDTETCDGLDNDGDGTVDEGFPDTDGDGSADCTETEVCDGLDNNGDGNIDEGFTDTDGDGVADCVDEETCDGVDNDGDGEVDEDMDDTDGDGICDGIDEEECDGLDNDGDGSVDEGFGDADDDGIADCIDTEECDGLDNDGDGLIDEGVTDDADHDGYTICDGDCDDTDPNVWPNNPEDLDATDNDCDGLIDEDYVDVGDIIVDEVMMNPAVVGDAWGEWFELTNTSSMNIYLNNWTIVGTGSYTFTIDRVMMIPAGDVGVFGTTTHSTLAGGVVADYVYSRPTMVLGDTSGTLSVYMDTTRIDTVTWANDGTWPLTAGYTMSLDPYENTATLNDSGANWCLAASEMSGGDMGTPGDVNDLCPGFDHDGDGYTGADGDCNDEDPTIYPGAPETDPRVDSNCDGIIGATPPVAVAICTDEEPVNTCSTIHLDGTGSWDADGDPILSYSWTLDSAPSGSILTTADINEENEPAPIFIPDEEGTFTFGLVVSDGLFDSVKDTVAVDVEYRGYNHAPVANAGSDSSYSDTAACTASGYGYTCDDCSTVVFGLNGTGTTDADGDPLVYSWTITSGDTYASLTNEDTASASLVVSGIPAEYGSTSTETIEVQLEVTDCEGESSTDTVTVAYDCTGA
jgi:hypothetical protein